MPRPVVPEGYCPRLVHNIRDVLAAAIRHEVIARNITTAQVRQYYPSFRQGDMRIIELGDAADRFGTNKLGQIAEAIGLGLHTSIIGASE